MNKFKAITGCIQFIGKHNRSSDCLNGFTCKSPAALILPGFFLVCFLNIRVVLSGRQKTMAGAGLGDRFSPEVINLYRKLLIKTGITCLLPFSPECR
jgi:hypothetical protein